MPPAAVRRPLLLALLLALVGTGLFFWWRGAGRPVYFCEAAATPAAYQNEWFYRLHEGPDGWLLRDDDLTTGFTLQPGTLGYLERLTDALEARGVTLVLAAQPPRGTALSAGSVPGYDPAVALRRYEQARAALEGTGLHVIDLAAVVADTPDYFFKRDHHWTPAGAEASAQAVARNLEATGSDEEVEPQAFRTERVGREEQLGSFGAAIGSICDQNPPAERLTRYATTAQETPAGSLFGNVPAPPITLVGTSNSAREDLNFAGFLEEATGLAVLNASAVGGGPQAALESYLRSETFHESTPAFIVWEFATLFDLPQDPRFYRQLIPSVGGVCTQAASTAAASRPVNGERVVLFETAPEGAANSLYLEFSDLSLTAFELGLSYRDGRGERVTLRRSNREANDGRYFWALNGRPKRVTLTLPEGADGSVQARLCP